MKKIIAFVTALALLFGFCAFADTKPAAVVEAGGSVTGDFDFDGEIDTLSFSCSLNEYNDGDFTITVNGKSFTVDDCIALEPVVCSVPMEYIGTLFMVSENGPSDDPLTYCFMYAMGELNSIGMIPATARNMTVDADGMITTNVRASMIGTWSRPADYVVAFGFHYDESTDTSYNFGLCEVPRDIYPMGMVVTLNRDLPVSASRFDSKPSLTLTSNQKVILAATDDCSWLYVTDLSNTVKGWVRIEKQDWADYVIVNGESVSVDDVFSDILYAD